MLRLYIANKNYSSWSLRPWVLMKQTGVAFEEVLVPFGNADGAASFDTFSPTAKVPCLVDGDLTVWDSLAIAEYLAESRPEVWPADKAARAWARCASAEMHSGFQRVRDVCTMNCGLRVRLHDQDPAFLAEWRRIDMLWCEGLDRFGGPFLAGAAFSAVDAFFAPVVFRVQTYSPELSQVARDYVARMLALPPMQDWYASALTEHWRDEPHEDEARSVGAILQDLRSAHR